MRMRERLLAAGHEQVASGGWAATSVVEVALRAGVSTGALYRHFSGKGELCAEIFRAAADREVSLMREIAARDGDARERLAACVETFLRRALAAPTLTYALMAEPVDPAVEQARIESKAAHRAVFAGLLAEGAAAGEWPPLDVEVAGRRAGRCACRRPSRSTPPAAMRWSPRSSASPFSPFRPTHQIGVFET